ncbi:MAG: phosphatidylglycerophosphatase A [Alphaproteobacteria bacterium]
MNKTAQFFATLFYVGYFPKAPGTIGSLFSLLLAAPFLFWGNRVVFAIALIILTVIGFWAAEVYRKDINTEDPKEVVIDELSGQWIILLFINPTIWWHWLLAFALFRLFDIIKPFPVDYLDKNIKGGRGIMIDDIAAAIMATIVFKICIWLI